MGLGAATLLGPWLVPAAGGVADLRRLFAMHCAWATVVFLAVLFGHGERSRLQLLFELISRYRNNVNFGLAVQVWLLTSVKKCINDTIESRSVLLTRSPCFLRYA